MPQIKHHLLTITVTLLAISALSNSAVVAKAPQMSEEKAALYTKYYEKRQGRIDDEKVAYELAQEFIGKFGTDDDRYVKAVREFVAKYEALQRELGFGQAFVAKDYPKAFGFGRQILSKEPENFKIMVQVVQAGYLNSQIGHTNLNAESMTLAKQALQLLYSKKVTDPA